MEEEEEDRVLLSALGVTSANPEDIERHIIEKVVFVFIYAPFLSELALTCLVVC